jgi:hypothetical protein
MKHTHRVRRIQTNLRPNKTNLLEEFDDFESYLQFLQLSQKQSPLLQPKQEQLNEARKIATARMTNRDRLRSHRQAGQTVFKERESSGHPYFPFYKCRIESSRSRSEDSKEGSFRINNHRFKLNYRIIEENMGKANSSISHTLVP